MNDSTKFNRKSHGFASNSQINKLLSKVDDDYKMEFENK